MLLAGHDYVPQKPTAYAGVFGAVQAFAESINAGQHLLGITGNTFVLVKNDMQVQSRCVNPMYNCQKYTKVQCH